MSGGGGGGGGVPAASSATCSRESGGSVPLEEGERMEPMGRQALRGEWGLGGWVHVGTLGASEGRA